MSDSTDHRQTWFGMIALIICGGILYALLMPACVYPRWVVNRTQCINNLKNLALATVNFESTKKQYPGYQSGFGKREDGAEKIGSWAVSLLPLLEQIDLRDQWDDPSTYDAWVAAVRGKDKDHLAAFYPSISAFQCPSDVSLQAEYGGSSYTANTGFLLLPNDPALELETYAHVADASERSVISQRSANGIFANRLGPNAIDPRTGDSVQVFGFSERPVRSDDVRDGLTQTILFSENCAGLNWREFSIADDSSRWKLGIVWLYAGASASEGRPKPMATTKGMRINENKLTPKSEPKFARPSSLHPGIVVASFADGSTKSIDEGIDYHVYQALLAPHDAKSDIPNLNYKLREDDYQL